MEIRHLQTFITIVELGGFSKAAEHLGYAQSTITSHSEAHMTKVTASKITLRSSHIIHLVTYYVYGR